MKSLSLVFSIVGLAAVAVADYPPVAVPGEGALLSAELIYSLEGRPTPQCHASTIVETPGGLVAAWFAGTREHHVDVGIWVARREGETWSKPVEVVTGAEGEEQDYPCWNPVLFQPAKGPLLLFYKVGPSPRMWWGALITSDDHGATWSKPRRLGTSDKLFPENRNLLGPVKNKPLQLSDGSILCASSTENRGWRVHFEVTRDLGKTFEVIGPIHDASKFDAIQPSILTYPDGRMQILCRTQQNVVATSWSNDGGKSWSPMKATSLPNPSAGTDALTLHDGRQLLVYNHAVRTPGKNGREVLNVAVSKDGQMWETVLTLEKKDRSAEFSYPAVIQSKDGLVHITYTWQRQTVKHVVLDPKKIK